MRRSTRLAEQEPKVENESQREPKAKKKRSNNKISAIATLDNGTMVEAFKYLNYCQLAKNSLVSKRFLDVIRTHRHKLALLYVDSIHMEICYNSGPACVKIFNKELSPEEYNEWVVCNNYSKKCPSGLDLFDYELRAYADYKDPNSNNVSVYFARVKSSCHKLVLKNKIWPLFEHFVRLLSDPSIYIRHVKLIPQNDVFNFLAWTFDRSVCGRSNFGRIQCDELNFHVEGHAPKFFNWIKNHMRCVKFQLAVENCHGCANCDKQLLDFYVTGSDCTSEIAVMYSHISKVGVVGSVQKFVDFKNGDESQTVWLFRSIVSTYTAKALKSHYAKFFVNDEKDRFGHTTAQVFEIVNNAIGKKLQITVKNLLKPSRRQVVLEIINL